MTQPNIRPLTDVEYEGLKQQFAAMKPEPGGGRMIPDALAQEMFQYPANIYAAWVRGAKPKPMTRRQRAHLRRRIVADRISLAIDALLGRHDCGQDY